MKKLATLFYGSVCYLYGMAILFYSILFVGGWFVPKNIDNAPLGDGINGLLINGLFLGLFAIQHTIMARPWFKERITKLIPQAAERSTFVLVTAMILHGMLYFWSSYPTALWNVTGTPLGTFLTGLSVFGFALGLYSSFQIDHFELFGLKQVFNNFNGKQFEEPNFVMPFLYKLVRNPLMLGFLVGFWATPVMTQGHLFFCVMVTGYVLVGIQFEERDIAKKLGAPYLEYKLRTPMLIPFKMFKGKSKIQT